MIIIFCQNIIFILLSQFHKTLPKSNLKMHWISVRFFEIIIDMRISMLTDCFFLYSINQRFAFTNIQFCIFLYICIILIVHVWKFFIPTANAIIIYVYFFIKVLFYMKCTLICRKSIQSFWKVKYAVIRRIFPIII